MNGPHVRLTGQPDYDDEAVLSLIRERQPGLVLPPADRCQVCAATHEADFPHWLSSLYYNVSFALAHDRFPTWLDAMAHCDAATQDLVRDELADMGEDIDAEHAASLAAAARRTEQRERGTRGE